MVFLGLNKIMKLKREKSICSDFTFLSFIPLFKNFFPLKHFTLRALEGIVNVKIEN